ncbi:S-layer homology domain-containing protein [Planococcus halocryophilus]|uniref:S-layer homology domain-containing protein n=1 Tax=Planococcus halocryophilus TaxID=1215089 RepID=UPI001F0F30E0|nr:S-layer homology domain-containing protein [Planococcus halocryophilus]MCH4826823.1 S-layer homology domain-containing protein [Planococcus halocryophilus]
MAYQPKNYKKFVATAATATLVASAIAPAAFADQASTSAFTDVGDRYTDAVDYVVSNNIANGLSETQFGVSASITRGDAAIMIAKAAGLMDEKAPASGFSDVPARGAIAVNSLKAAGIISGVSTTKFGWDQSITRGQAAYMLAQAYDLKGGDASKLKFTDVGTTHRFAKEVAALVENEITAGTTSTSFGIEASIKRGDFAIFLHKLSKLEATPSTPAVTSVTALNGTELQVKFSTAVDATDAKDLMNYSLVDSKGVVNFDSAVVSEDGMTVTLTSHMVMNVTNATLTIEPIVTKADAKVSTSKYVSLFTYTDNVAPTVSSIKAEGTEAIVTFSEDLATEGTVSLDGTVLVKGTDYTVSGKTLKVVNLKADQAYKLDIVGAKDAAGNMSGQITSNFTVAKPVVDDVKPTVSTSVTGNMLTLSFSEKVAPGTVTIAGTSVTTNLVASEDEKTYTVDVQAAGLLNGKTFVNGQVVVNGFKDMTTNTMNEVKFDATFTADTTAPKFISASIKTAANGTDDKILLTFDDAVSEGLLTDSNELVITSIDGIFQSSKAVDLVKGFNVAYGYDLDGKDGIKGNEKNIVAIDFDSVEESTYTFELAGKVVVDSYNNAVANTINFSATAPKYVTTPGTVSKTVEFSAVTPSTNNKDITVLFNKKMSNSALTASNYTLGGKALPTGTTLKFVDDRSKVVVTLPQGSVTANGSYAFAATNLTDVDGNTLVNDKATETISLKENVVPVATKITVSNSNTFSVDFTEAITAGTPTKETVIVKVNGTTVDTTGYSVINGDLVVQTAKNFAITDSISVEFKASDLTDVNLNKVANGTVTK